MAHAIASQIVLFPNPFEPRMTTTCASRSTVTDLATPAKPEMVTLRNLISPCSRWFGHEEPGSMVGSPCTHQPLRQHRQRSGREPELWTRDLLVDPKFPYRRATPTERGMPGNAPPR